MVLKIEIRGHDGLGRITKLISNDKVLLGPNLIEPFSIPVFHDPHAVETDEQSLKQTSEISLGYFPALHYFSKLTSDEEVINVLQDVYAAKLQQTDFVSFPLDTASSYRTSSRYPEFILKISESLDLNFGWIYSQRDSKTDWSTLKILPLMILGDLSTIYKNQRLAWKYIVELEKNYPLNLKYAPTIPPVLFPLYAYLGIDFFDSLYGQYMAQNNIFLDADELVHVTDFNNFYSPCKCPACENRSEFETSTHWLTNHNQNFTEIMIRKIQYAINQGTLRDLVKKYVLMDSSSTALLRIADLDTENRILEKYNPILKRQKLILTSTTDYTRPEMRMYHDRVKSRFTIPDWTKMVLLIPCSAKKPYSESKSHRMFASTIKQVMKSKRHSILELIITSPLGVVPRFLEQVYPAGMYDIPVTGNWTELEQNTVDELLLQVFSQLPSNIPIVSYLAEPEKSIIKKFSNNHPSYSIHILDLDESETSDTSLKLFRNYLFSIKDSIEGSNTKNKFELEFFKAMANYQLGKNAGDAIFPSETEIKRRGYVLTAFFNNKQLATLHLGHLALTVYAASRLAETHDSYKVYFADSEVNGSAIYTPGIVKADQQIRPDDDVLIMSEKTGKFIALGKSHLTGFELENCSYGLGVSIKKKLR